MSIDETASNEQTGLPANWREIVDNGIDALLWAENSLDRELLQASDPTALLAAIRDVSELAKRLRDATETEWRSGYVRVFLSQRDLDLLEEWEHRGMALRNSRSDRSGEARQRAPHFRALRLFLEAYLSGTDQDRSR